MGFREKKEEWKK